MEASRLDLSALSPEQLRAVTSVEGPMLVVAGAGSGKTRVLTYRIAYLLEQGVAPSSVLALTFTNKAARVMRERIAGLVGTRARGLYMGTFHSIFLRILRAEAETLGFSSSFSVYDTSASRAMVKRVIAHLNLDSKQYDAAKVLARLSRAKNNLLLPQQYRMNDKVREQDERARRPKMGDIYEAYHRRMREANAMDFDDILVYMYLLLYRHEAVRDKYQAQFRYVLVDEFQDTNEVQNRILRLLVSGHQNLCVVGDDAQSIYAFRGARIQNILDFSAHYGSCERVTLSTNYRSTSAIVEAANRLIAHNRSQLPKQCVAYGGEGSPVRIKVLQNSSDEARYVAESIQEVALREHVPYEHFAVLYRTHALSRELELALRRRDIPYMVYKGLAFWQRKEVMDLMAYFKLCLNPQDAESLRRVINFPPRGIGDGTMSQLEAAAADRGMGLWEGLQDLDGLGVSLRAGARSAVEAFVWMVQEFHSQVNNLDAKSHALAVYKRSGLEAHYAVDKSEEGEARVMNLGEVFNAIEQFTAEQSSADEYDGHVITLAEFVDQCMLASDADVAEESVEHKVVLATVHASKGLEYDYVYVVGLDEGGFPSRRALQEPHGEEEERRLCYVAVTRAAKQLVLTSVRERMLQGRTELFVPSRFLRELDPAFRVGGGSASRLSGAGMRGDAGHSLPLGSRPRRLVPVSEASARASGPGTDPASLYAGCRVRHATYGEGTVRRMMDEGMAAKAVVQFDGSSGEKTLMLRFAQLEVL